MPFQDRSEAGRLLARELVNHIGDDVVVFALPRGGVPVALEIAKALHAPLDLALVRKLGVPFQRELAMGAVADAGRPIVVRNEDVIARAGVSETQFDEARRRELKEIERRRSVYLRAGRHTDVRGRIAIVVDDGIATGATTRAALRSIRALEPKSLILATPVAAPDALEALRSEADEIICLESPREFFAIGPFYADFHQLGDDEVVAILETYKPQAKGLG